MVEAAGLLAHCDSSLGRPRRATEGLAAPSRPRRADSGRKQVVVDAKVPLAAVTDACEAEDDDVRSRPADHARQVRDHLGKLAQKSYWRQFEPSPDFVIMFVPDETLSFEPRRQRQHAERGWLAARGHPRFPIDLLHPADGRCTRQRDTVAQSAREVHELGRELYTRLATMSGLHRRIGKGARQRASSTTTSSRAVAREPGSCRRVGSRTTGIEGDSARRRRSSGKAIPLQAPELVEPGEQLRAIDAA